MKQIIFPIVNCNKAATLKNLGSENRLQIDLALNSEMTPNFPPQFFSWVSNLKKQSSLVTWTTLTDAETQKLTQWIQTDKKSIRNILMATLDQVIKTNCHIDSNKKLWIPAESYFTLCPQWMLGKKIGKFSHWGSWNSIPEDINLVIIGNPTVSFPLFATSLIINSRLNLALRVHSTFTMTHEALDQIILKWKAALLERF